MAHYIFTRATFNAENDLSLYEEIHQNCVFHCRDCDLRCCAGGGPALVQNDRQKLPYEQRQGVQLRQELRLLANAVSRKIRVGELMAAFRIARQVAE